MKRLVISGVVVAILGLMLIACGDDDSVGGKQAQTEDGLKKAAKGYAEATYRLDTDATYLMWARSCRDGVSKSDWGATLKAAQVLFEGFTKQKFSDLKVDEVQVRNFTPAKAEAMPVTRANGKAVDADPKFIPYEYQDGRWVETDCSGMRFGR